MVGRAWALPLLLFVTAAACLVAAVVTGGARAGLLLIFPFIAGSSWLVALGTLLAFAAIFSAVLVAPGAQYVPEVARPTGAPPSESTSGGLVLIGPFPIFFGR